MAWLTLLPHLTMPWKSTWSDFKGTSKMVQIELLYCMLSVVREQIIKEAQKSDFLSIQADETLDISTQNQLVLVLHYIDDRNTVQERFFELIPLSPLLQH